MTICTFTTDDYHSDVHVRASVGGGYQTMVATNRVVFTVDLPPLVPKSDFDNWIHRRDKVLKIALNSERVKIGGPYDGRTLVDADLPALFTRLTSLKHEGYRVPASALVAVKDEIMGGIE